MTIARLAPTLLVLTLAAAGCSGGAETTREQTAYDVRESANQLSIVGRDGQGAEVATLELIVGRFTMQDDGRVVDGRQLHVRANGKEAVHESEGMRPLNLPVGHSTDSTAIDQFLLEPVVKAALSRWQVQLTVQAPSAQRPRASAGTEKPLFGCSYAASSSCGVTSCAEDPHFDAADTTCTVRTQEYVCCGGSRTAVERFCGMGSANPCGAEGPNGCAVCWAASFSNSCDATSDATTYQTWCDTGSSFLYATGNYTSISYN